MKVLFHALAPVLALCASANADLITWSTPENTTGPSDVRTNGTLLTARNAWAQVFASPTVNGVTFTAFTPLTWGGGFWDNLAGATTGDAEYDSMLDNGLWATGSPAGNPSEWGGIQLDTLGALENGHTYEIQVWYTDQRTGSASNVLFDRQMQLSSATGLATLSGGIVSNLTTLTQGTISAPLEADPNNDASAADTIFGQFAVGTFTRTTTEPLYLLVQGVHPLASNVVTPHITAFQIRDLSGGSVGTPICDPMDPNSTGQSTKLSGTFGSGVGIDLNLQASQGPDNQFGYMLVGSASADPGVAVSNGRLCIGGSFGRYNVAGGVYDSLGRFDPSGVLVNLVGTATSSGGIGFDVPSLVPIMGYPPVNPGSSWTFQLWHRESGGQSNFSNALAVTFP